ncbi:MAG TPA: hypothetical protein VM759_06240, partial [Longimicrobium sp.]|nr:hypothetical protein [Longimicrobium sp.]
WMGLPGNARKRGAHPDAAARTQHRYKWIRSPIPLPMRNVRIQRGAPRDATPLASIRRAIQANQTSFMATGSAPE